MGGKASKWWIWRSARICSLTPEEVQRSSRVQTARLSAEYQESEYQTVTLSSMAPRMGLDKLRRRKAFMSCGRAPGGLGLCLERCDLPPNGLINELQTAQ